VLLDGARWWESAFEAIGYKDAFQVKILPENADPMDVRYNVIQWVHRSTRGWSYGSSVIDPRTGEILKGHVTLGSLRVRQDYLIAQGLMPRFSGDGENDQALLDLALARIRQLSAHEVGHTLGIAHNFAASSYGRESVMDYPHPQFEIDRANPKIIVAPNAYGVGLGRWDKAVVAYGYQDFPANVDELGALKQMIADNDDKGLLYISDADSRSAGDAHVQSSLWDNGENAVDELENVVNIRRVALDNFSGDNLQNGRAWSDLEEVFVPVYFFHRYQTTAAAKWLGGVSYDYATKGASSTKFQRAAADQQQRAMNRLLETLSPSFLIIKPEIADLIQPKAAGSRRTRESTSGKTGVTLDQISLAAASAQHTLSLLLHPQRLARLLQQNAVNSELPSITSLTDALHESVIDNQYQGLEASIHHAVIDVIYSNYINLVRDESVSAAVKMQINAAIGKERKYMSKQASKAKSGAYRGVYSYQAQRLVVDRVSENDKLIDLPKLPPGSPI